MKLCYDKKSKDPTYFVQHGYRYGSKTTTKNIYRIGKHSELLAQGHEDPLEYAKQVVSRYNEEFLSNKVNMQLTIDFDQKLIASNNIASDSTLLNIGYFFLQSIYSKLKIKDFLDELSDTRKFSFNLNDITRFIVFDRILNPKSKLSTLKDLSHFYEKPTIEYQHILRGMDVLAENYDKYINHLFVNSNNIVTRDTSVCYYDCTNYYFEIEDADIYIDEVTGKEVTGLRQYGPSKEHRPNPIVEMGLFMDKDGIPISMGIFSGNMNEQKTVSDVETKMIKSLKKKEFIYCGDAGLGSASIRAFNDMGGRAFIVTQSIKKLNEEFQNELLKDEGFKLLSNDKAITKKGVDDIRKGPNDISRFIMKENQNKDVYILNEEKIAQKEKFDGFYALATNLLEDKEKDIININSERYKIEDCFRVLKTNFDARPVYHRLDNRITAHFMICYTALLIYRLLEKLLKNKKYFFTINQILDTLKVMNITNRDNLYYEATYTSSAVLTALNEVFNLELDRKNYLPTTLTKKIKKISK